MDSKRGEDLAENTLYKHTLTLTRLQEFCDREGIYFVKDITLGHLTTWRAGWPFESPLAKRNNQERVKSFFKFCYDAGVIPANPTAQLSTIQVKADEANNVRPFEPKEYKTILAAVSKTGLTAPQSGPRKGVYAIAAMVRAVPCRRAVLGKGRIATNGKVFRVRTQRRKTGTHINNVIPSWLGKELLRVKNGNLNYFFISEKPRPRVR